MRLPELWTWLNGVPGSRYAKMMADDTQHPIGIRDLENVTSSDRSYFSLPEQAVIPRPSPAIVPSTPEPSTGPASTASFLSSSANLLNVLQHTHPPIYWDRDVRLPESVRALRERLVTNFGHGVIPTEFREKLEFLDPDLLPEIPEGVFKETQTVFADQLWEKVLKIYHTARESQLNCEDENRWAGSVVHPILEMTINDRVLIARSVQSQAIDPKIQPRLYTRTRIAKKVDFVLGFNPKHNKVYNTLQEISRQFPDLSLGLTKNPFIKRVPAIAVVEIKPFGGDEAEGFSQLAIGLSSLLERTRQLQTLQGTDTHSILPVVGILITGHTWSTYIAFRGYWGNNERTYIDGPLERVCAGTRSIEGICKLLNLMHRISTYAEYIYWPWFANSILTPLTRDRAFQ